MHKSNYGLELLVNGRPVKEYYKADKAFVESRNGTEYTLRFRNNSWKRVMAIFSVDGVEVLKGKAAAEADNGYIVDAFSSIEVKGYRIDDKNVAAFKFAETAQGYNVTVGAASVNEQTGETTYDKSSRNSGVIGVRVIEEGVADHDYVGSYKQTHNVGSRTLYAVNGLSLGQAPATGYSYITGFNTSQSINISGCTLNSSRGYVISGQSVPILKRQNVNQMGQLSTVARSITTTSTTTTDWADIPTTDNASFGASLGDSSNRVVAFGAAASCFTAPAAPTFDASTTWGAKLEDKVKEVTFKRSTNITDIEIYYASRASLAEFGIDFENTKQIFSWPAAFEDKKQYCKLPPGYKA